MMNELSHKCKCSIMKITENELSIAEEYERIRSKTDDLFKNGNGFLGCTFLTFCKKMTITSSFCNSG